MITVFTRHAAKICCSAANGKLDDSATRHHLQLSALPVGHAGSGNTVGRAFAGKPVVVPNRPRKPATLSWAAIRQNDRQRCTASTGEVYNVNSAEHHTWGEIADYYKDICNLGGLGGQGRLLEDPQSRSIPDGTTLAAGIRQTVRPGSGQ